MKRSVLSVALALALVTMVAAIATATSRHDNEWVPQRHVRSVHLSAFHNAFRPTATERAQRAEIRHEFRHAPRQSTVASAAFDASRPVTIPETQTDVWIAPADDGGACTFIDDPLGGYGSSCAAPQAIASGQASTILVVGDGSPLSGKAIVALVEPDGAPAPSVHRPDGSSEDLPIANNLAAGVASPGDVIYSGANRIVVPTPPRHRQCAEPQPGEQFKRCA